MSDNNRRKMNFLSSLLVLLVLMVSAIGLLSAATHSYFAPRKQQSVIETTISSIIPPNTEKKG